MSKILPGKFHNLEFGAPEAARVAARRAGLSLNEWIETVVADKAEALGLYEDELDEDDRLDAVVERLTRLKLRAPRRDSVEPHKRRARVFAGDSSARKASRSQPEAQPRARSKDRSDAHMLEQVIHHLATIEERLGIKDQVATVTEFRPKRGGGNESILAQALARLESTMAEQQAPRRVHRAQIPLSSSLVRAAPTSAQPSGRDTIFAEMESQINALSKSIGARHSSAGVEAPRSYNEPAHNGSATRRSSAYTGVSFGASGASIDQLHAEIAKLAADMEEMRRTRPNPDIVALRQDLAKMAQIVAQLASKSSIEDLEARLTNLLYKMSSTKDEGLARTVLTPVANLVVELREVMKGLSPNESLNAIERQISALSQKITILETSGYDPEAFAALQQQSEHIHHMVQQLASRPDVFDALEHQLGYLTEKIENIVRTPDRSGLGDVVQAIDDIRQLVEQKLATSTVSVLEQRLDDLSGKIDQALRRPQFMPDMPGATSGGQWSLERMARDLENKMNEARQPAADPEAFAALQQQMGLISSQMDRSQASLSVLTSLEQSMKDLFRELDSTRHMAVEVAEQAAERAVRESARDLLETMSASTPAPQVDHLSRSIQDMLRAQDEADQRATATMVAVHDVLEKLTERLGAIEDDLAGVKHHAAATQSAAPIYAAPQNGAPQGAVQPPKMATAPVMPRAQAFNPAHPAINDSTSLDDDEFLIEPRAGARATHGNPLPLTDTAQTLHTPEPDESSPPVLSTKVAFIAAARRAAQAATQGRQEDVAAHLDAAASGALASGGLLERARTFAERRKRPLLLGIAAVMMAILGIQLARNPDVEADKRPPMTVAAPASSPRAASSAADAAALAAKTPAQEATPSVRMIAPTTPNPGTDNKAQDPSAASAAPQATNPAVKSLPQGPMSLNDMSASPSRFVKGVMALNTRGFVMTRQPDSLQANGTTARPVPGPMDSAEKPVLPQWWEPVLRLSLCPPA